MSEQDDDELIKVTVLVTRRSYRALEDGAQVTGYSKTDTINRALQFYTQLVGARHIGEKLYLGQSLLRARRLEIDWFKDGGDV